MFIASSFLNLSKQFIPIKILLILFSASCLNIEHLESLPFVFDILLDEGILHSIAFGERTDVGVGVSGLVVHEHVIILYGEGLTFL